MDDEGFFLQGAHESGYTIMAFFVKAHTNLKDVLVTFQVHRQAIWSDWERRQGYDEFPSPALDVTRIYHTCDGDAKKIWNDQRRLQWQQ